MSEQAISPRILEAGWGRVDTEVGTFRDAKLWPGGGRGWDWRETGTDHTPGIRVADLDELLAADPEVVILSRGRYRRLRVPADTVAKAGAAGATVEVLPSDEAISRYNQLADEGKRVAALIHSTC